MGYSPWGCKESDMAEHMHPWEGKQAVLSHVAEKLGFPGVQGRRD